MNNELLLYVLVFNLLHQVCESSYAGYSYRRMCMKIVYLDTELLKDAIRKVESVQHIRLFYRKSHEYQLGSIVYDLRKKFRRMVQLYRRSFDHMSDEDHNKHMIRWVEIHQLHLDVDNLIKATIRYQNIQDKKEDHKATDYDEQHPTSAEFDYHKPAPFPSDSDEDELGKILGEMKKGHAVLRSRGKHLQIKPPLWKPNSKLKINRYRDFNVNY